VEPSGDSGPTGTRLENAVIVEAVSVEAVIALDANDNDADVEDNDEDGEDLEDDEKVVTEDIEDGEDEKQTANNDGADDDDDEDDDEDVDLTPADRRASVGRRSRRVTPTLSNVVFDTDLILKHKVPILRKKASEQEPAQALTGPVFLNGDQYDKLYPREDRRGQQQQQQQQAQGHGAGAGKPKQAQVQAQAQTQAQPKQRQLQQQQQQQQQKQAEPVKESRAATKQRTTGSVRVRKQASPRPKWRPRQGPLSWASKLFGRGLSAPRSEQQMAMEESNARRIMLSRESSVRSSDLKSVQSVQSEQTTTADSVQSGESQQSKGMEMSLGVGVSIGRVSSFSRIGSPKSVGSRASSVSVVCAPSEGAVKWREKQIQYGTNTEGYKNFIAQYPNKDAQFRLSNEFVPTPDPKEKIGKKRWVGKYQKWRKFLHKFDTVAAPSTEGSSSSPSKLHETATETQTETTETEVEGDDDREQSL